MDEENVFQSRHPLSLPNQKSLPSQILSIYAIGKHRESRLSLTVWLSVTRQEMEKSRIILPRDSQWKAVFVCHYPVLNLLCCNVTRSCVVHALCPTLKESSDLWYMCCTDGLSMQHLSKLFGTHPICCACATQQESTCMRAQSHHLYCECVHHLQCRGHF